MFKLVIQDDEGKTTVVALIRDEITIGRKEGNTIRLTERNVSRRHARILRGDGTIQIEDLGSYNGVRVNGAKIAQRTSLSVSDRAQIGDYLLELKADVKAEATPEPALAKAAVDHAIENQLTTPMAVPPVPEAVPRAADDAPTVKAAAPVPAGKRARLVALSSNFAGQEWVLDGDEIVLGRTEDNDAVINHRSISRNHARLVRNPENGRYTISDLQSQNGVRVNGEEYGKFELRRGDLVDLGHVRLRFVEPGENFVFGRDAQVSDVPVASTSRPLVIGALAVLLVGVALGAYMVMSRGNEAKPQVAGGGSGSGTGAGSGSGSGSGSNTTVAVAPQPDAATPMTRPDAAPPTGAAELVTKLTKCRTLIDREAWADLQACAEEASELDASSAEAKTLAEQARRELANQLLLDRISDAARSKAYDKVASEYAKIDLDSVYRERARAAHDKARDAYQAQQVAVGRGLARKGKCDDLKRLAGQSGDPWPEVGAAVGAIECAVTVAGDPPVVDTPPEACNYEALLAQAEDAFAASNSAPALKYAEQAIKCNGTPTKPRIIALVSACKLGNVAKANAYYKQVGSKTPPSLLSACLKIITL